MILFRVKGTFEWCSEAALFSWPRLLNITGARRTSVNVSGKQLMYLQIAVDLQIGTARFYGSEPCCFFSLRCQ